MPKLQSECTKKHFTYETFTFFLYSEQQIVWNYNRAHGIARNMRLLAYKTMQFSNFVEAFSLETHFGKVLPKVTSNVTFILNGFKILTM